MKQITYIAGGLISIIITMLIIRFVLKIDFSNSFAFISATVVFIPIACLMTITLTALFDLIFIKIPQKGLINCSTVNYDTYDLVRSFLSIFIIFATAYYLHRFHSVSMLSGILYGYIALAVFFFVSYSMLEAVNAFLNRKENKQS